MISRNLSFSTRSSAASLQYCSARLSLTTAHASLISLSMSVMRRIRSLFSFLDSGYSHDKPHLRFGGEGSIPPTEAVDMAAPPTEAVDMAAVFITATASREGATMSEDGIECTSCAAAVDPSSRPRVGNTSSCAERSMSIVGSAATAADERAAMAADQGEPTAACCSRRAYSNIDSGGDAVRDGDGGGSDDANAGVGGSGSRAAAGLRSEPLAVTPGDSDRSRRLPNMPKLL
mmetsp:Transcript_158893/g.509620  ORF Transcript_158893/g.509620 Transcript_158893/m.509620 type:complete len:232 (-) Transcript_158893:759-1454(-)